MEICWCVEKRRCHCMRLPAWDLQYNTTYEIMSPFTVAALVNIIKSMPLNPMKPSLAVKCRIGVWCVCGPVSPPLYCIFEYFFCSLSAWAPAFIESNSEPDGQCMCRMQMVLSGPALYARPSVSPSPCSSSFLAPCKFSCIIASYRLPRNSTWSQNTRGVWEQGPFTPNPPLSVKAPFCSFHNYHSERMPNTPKWARK